MITTKPTRLKFYSFCERDEARFSVIDADTGETVFAWDWRGDAEIAMDCAEESARLDHQYAVDPETGLDADGKTEDEVASDARDNAWEHFEVGESLYQFTNMRGVEDYRAALKHLISIGQVDEDAEYVEIEGRDV